MKVDIEIENKFIEVGDLISVQVEEARGIAYKKGFLIFIDGKFYIINAEDMYRLTKGYDKADDLIQDFHCKLMAKNKDLKLNLLGEE